MAATKIILRVFVYLINVLLTSIAKAILEMFPYKLVGIKNNGKYANREKKYGLANLMLEYIK